MSWLTDLLACFSRKPKPPAPPAPAGNYPVIPVCLVDFGGTGVNPTTLPGVAAALQRQVNEHFALPAPRGYGIFCTVRAASSPQDVKPNEWVLGLFATPDMAGALGYHDRTADGLPLAKIFPPLDAQDGVNWTTTASHELLEMLFDPELARCVQASDNQIWAYEVCDAVESDSYVIDGVEVSNFILPSYFENPPNATKFDYLGLCKAPLEIRPGGYGQTYDPSAGWTQHQSAQQAPRKYRLTVRGRAKRRAE